MAVIKAPPITNEPIKLLSGRFGHYVTDGTTNASLPKGATPDDLTFEQAVVLLSDRAAMGPSKKSKRRAAASAPKKKAAKNCYNFAQHPRVWLFDAYAGPSLPQRQLHAAQPAFETYLGQRRNTERSQPTISDTPLRTCAHSTPSSLVSR